MDFARKRKFNALLQGLGTRPSSPAGSELEAELQRISSTASSKSDTMASAVASRYRPQTTSELELLAKRRRLGMPATTPTKQTSSTPTYTSSTTTVSNIILRKWGGGSQANTTQQNKPRYCPGDRDELIKRLATYQDITDWTPKPDRVSEIEWAKRGWICNGKERVRCTLCNKELVVKLNRKEVEGKEQSVLVASEIGEALVDKYVELITESHTEDCLWRRRGCDDTLLRLPLATPQTTFLDVRRRYDDLCARKDFLPYICNLRLPETLDLDIALTQLPPNFFSDPAPPTTNPPASAPSKPALALALTGWEGLSNARIGPIPNSASCHTCLRRLGLWMFKSKSIDPETNAILEPAPMDFLDPVSEHRSYCPWKNGDVQRNPGASASSSSATATATAARRLASKHNEDAKVVLTPAPAGWEVLAQLLRNEAFLRERTINGNSGQKRPMTAHRIARSIDVGTLDNQGSINGTPTPHTPARQSMIALSTPGTAPPAFSGADGVIGEEGLLGEESGEGEEEEAEEDEATRAAKDKERWARLRRVKSLFDTKGAKRLRKSMNLGRPETASGSRLRDDATAEQESSTAT